MSQPLFRKEAIDYQVSRLEGDVVITPSLSFSMVLMFLLVWIALVFAWLLTGTYARKETVVGWLEPSGGITKVYVDHTGFVEKVYVKEGDVVEEGQLLFKMSTKKVMGDGSQLDEVLLNEYQKQKIYLENKLIRIRDNYVLKKGDIEAAMKSADEELNWLEKQNKTLHIRYKIVESRVEKYEALSDVGHISKLAYETSLDEKLGLKTQIEDLSRRAVSQKGVLDRLRLEKNTMPGNLQNELEQLNSQISVVEQDIMALRAQNTRIYRASRAGAVANLQVFQGQKAGVSTPAMYLLPKDEELKAHILLPVRSAGFVKPGQKINIRYDAFPYQKFGLYVGEIEQISHSVQVPNEINHTVISAGEPVYRILAGIESQNIKAYGNDLPLKVGMTLSADVKLDDRTLLQWLLEPIYSIKGKL